MWFKKINFYLNDKFEISHNLTVAINIILILLSLNTLSNNLGMYDKSLMLIFSTYLFLSFIFINIPFKKLIFNLIKKPIIKIKLFLGIFIIFVSFFVFLFSNIQMLWITTIPIFIIGINLICNELSIIKKEFPILIITSFIYSIFYILLQSVQQIWNYTSEISLFFSNFIGNFIGKSLFFGPSISGLWIVIIFFFYFITLLILFYKTEKILKIFFISTFGLLLSWILYIIILAFFDYNGYYMNSILIVFCFIPAFILTFKSNIKKSKIQIHGFDKINYKKIIKTGWVYSVIFLFISIILLTSFIGESNAESNNKNILFYGQNMLGNWDIPEYGKYGREASGMFGLLPIYLSALDYNCKIVVDNITRFIDKNQPEILINNSSIYSNQTEYISIKRYTNLTDFVKIIESPQLTKEVLKDVDIFVVVNINYSFSNVEKNIIWDFVKNGGSLLVLGDHTNVGEIQQPLNDLIDEVGIRFRFDSGLPLDPKFKWLTCYQLPYSSIISDIKDNDEIQISVGASLDIPSSSFPIIIGRYAFSDYGDIENKDFAYLGDYEYNHGEKLGDIILAAGLYYGSGKVIVFGDTSSFQNSAMAYSFWFISDIFSYLSSNQTGLSELLFTVSSLIFLFLSILLIYKDKKVRFYVFPLATFVAILLSSTINFSITDTSYFVSSSDVVFIDSSHNERFSIESFTDDSLNGVILNLNRNGFLPIFLKEFSEDKIKKSKILILNAPTKKINYNEIRFLNQYMSDGGFVILATGYNDKDSVELFLNEFQLDVEEIPLGPVPYVEDDIEVYENESRFVDSWPIVFNKDIGISYYSFNFTWSDELVSEYHLMVFIRHGLGGLLLISDSSYLLDKNIESIYDYWPGNILMLKHIIDEFREMEAK